MKEILGKLVGCKNGISWSCKYCGRGKLFLKGNTPCNLYLESRGRCGCISYPINHEVTNPPWKVRFGAWRLTDGGKLGMELAIRHRGNIEVVDIGSGFWVRSEGRPLPTLCADSRDGKSQFDIIMNVALCDRMIKELQKLKERLSVEAPPSKSGQQIDGEDK